MKTLNYFITGLPRSGTAWLANALTWGNSFCHHEAIAECQTMDEYADVLNATEATHVGDCDTGVALVLPWLCQRYPFAKYVFIRRDPDACRASLTKAGFATHQLAEIQRSMQWGMEHIESLVIDFEDLFCSTEIVWDYLGLPDFPRARFEMLHDMKIDDSASFLGTQPMGFVDLMKEAI